MKILAQLCSVPTAPFAEDRVIAYVEQFVAARPTLKLSRDRFDNLLIELPSKRRRGAARRLVCVAHMDHPGLVARKMIDSRTLEADFHGGVLSDYVRGARVIFFDGEREIPGTIISTTADQDRPNYPGKAAVRLNSTSSVESRFRGAVRAGSPGMFDLGTGRTKSGKFYSRVCDDLAGAAAALALLDQLHRNPPKNPIAVLLTRAEESGFIGAIASVLHPALLKKSDLIISIECSAMQPYARQGDGVILRVGDYTSIFNSAFMYFLHLQAQALAKRDAKFKYQRSLMPGGTCEATVFDVYGYTAGGICVPLGNYHNMDREKRKLGPEYVDLADWNNMVKLFVQVAKHAHEFESDLGPLKRRIEKRFAKHQKRLGK